jgi:DNA adenine methylase
LLLEKIVQTEKFSPLLKWAGGKRWLYPNLLPIWQAHTKKRLIEPFCGGLAIVLGLAPEKALLNDVNPHLINFYKQVQQGLQINEIFQNERIYYFEARTQFNQLILEGKQETPEAAQWFYYLNRTGFNGLCRFNNKGLFNVPFGQYQTINYTYNFTSYQQTLEQWQFSNADFEALHPESSDFIYADPPYDVPFTTYSQGGFTWEDQLRLATWLSQQPCPVVTSNQATERILKLYSDLGFEITLLDAPRRISCTGDRTPAKEMLAVKGQ